MYDPPAFDEVAVAREVLIDAFNVPKIPVLELLSEHLTAVSLFKSMRSTSGSVVTGSKETFTSSAPLSLKYIVSFPGRKFLRLRGIP